MSLGRSIKVLGGALKEMPLVGLGTWQSPVGEVQRAVEVALKAGYRHIDCAAVYGNEQEVGEGIAAAKVAREDIWVTSKLWNSFHRPEQVEVQLRKTLSDLKLDYLDLYLMHWPVAFTGEKNGKKEVIDWTLTLDHSSTWAAMERLVDAGLVRHIGVSNFTIGRIQKLQKTARIPIAANQVELNLNCAQPGLIEWCQANNIIVQSYSPLGSTGATQRDDPVVASIAKTHGVDPANILISWQVARGCVVLPKSVTPTRIVSNFKDVVLTAEQLKQLNDRAASQPEKRTVDPSKFWGVDIYKEVQAKL